MTWLDAPFHGESRLTRRPAAGTGRPAPIVPRFSAHEGSGTAELTGTLSLATEPPHDDALQVHAMNAVIVGLGHAGHPPVREQHDFVVVAERHISSGIPFVT